jgi:hypothetical protein
VYVVVDALQLVCQGVLRSAGLQRLGAIVTLLGFNAGAMPLAVALAVAASMRLRGLWTGMAVGYALICVAYGAAIRRLDWQRASDKAIDVARGGWNAVGEADTWEARVLGHDGPGDYDTERGAGGASGFDASLEHQHRPLSDGSHSPSSDSGCGTPPMSDTHAQRERA